MDMYQPPLFPECLPCPVRDPAEIVMATPGLSRDMPDSWSETEPETKAWVLEGLLWAQPLELLADATGLPLTAWREDPEFDRQVTQVEAMSKVQIGIALIQAAVHGSNRQLQVRLLDILHQA